MLWKRWKKVKTPYLDECRLPEYLVGLAGELELLDNLRWLVHLENDACRHNTEAVMPLSQVLNGQHPRPLHKAGSRSITVWYLELKKVKKQCCGYGKFIPDPDFSNPDPGSRGQKGTGSRIWICSTELAKNLINFYPKIVTMLSDIWSRIFFSPGSGSGGHKKHRIPDPQQRKKTTVQSLQVNFRRKFDILTVCYPVKSSLSVQ